MFAMTEHFLAVGQLTEQVYVMLLLINFGISLGLLAGFLYSISYLFRIIRPVKNMEVDKRLEAISKQLETVQEALGKVDVTPILEKITQLETRIGNLESRTALLERRLFKTVEAKPSPILQPRPLPEEELPALSKLSDIILLTSDVKFAGVITSQGFLVESYGSCSEEPARLLEVIRLYGSSTTSIVKGRSRFEIFHLGDVKDISVYGILEFKDNISVAEQTISRAKKAISKYFAEKLAAKGA